MTGERAEKDKAKESLIVVVSSPSGGGKTTIVNELLESVSGLRKTVSYTTREPRAGEKDREDYIFISGTAFKERIKQNEFLEWEQKFGSYYGTSAGQVAKLLAAGEDIVLSIDVRGASNIKKKFPESISVFIMPPSVEALTERLRKRNTEKDEQMEIRIKEAEQEIASADEFDNLIVNENLGDAIEELKSIIALERQNRKGKAK